MAGRDLGFLKSSTGNLKEQLQRTTLRNVRAQGHPYVDLREDGKKLIFFCTLCLSPCYGDPSLFNHLKGNLHTRRLATAKLTLLKRNPWPFDDGVLFFFDNAKNHDRVLPVSSFTNPELLDVHDPVNSNTAMVRYGRTGGNTNYHLSRDMDEQSIFDENLCDRSVNGDGCLNEIVIPSVLLRDGVSNLVAKHMGIGNICARFSKKNGVSDEIRKVWCEWFGDMDLSYDDVSVTPEHDFAIVTFPYDYDLGRKRLVDGFRYLLPSSPHSGVVDGCNFRGKKRTSLSDPVDITNHYDSSGEELQSSNNMDMILIGNDDQLVLSRVISSKSMRKEVREQNRVASVRSCDLCRQKMLPNKDVAALFNRKTHKFVCSSRNSTGAFHVFHVSCLIHWILLCEVEIYDSVAPKMKRKSWRKMKNKSDGTRINCGLRETMRHIYSAFCPECQGTGIVTNGEDLEIPSVPLSEIFKYKIKLCNARKEWMKNPEVLQNCSIGFHFPPQTEEKHEEIVATLKRLHFYRAHY